MNESQYIELLNKASINEEKFQSISEERPRSKGRPVKHYNNNNENFIDFLNIRLHTIENLTFAGNLQLAT